MGIQKQRALTFIDTLLQRPSGDMFFIYPLMGTYLHFEDVLPEELKGRMKEVFHSYTPYRGDTENHWVMYYTALLLAAQTWPDEDGDFWFNGKSSQENYEEAQGWLEEWMRLTTTIGQGEFDSPDYGAVFLSPMFLLYDFARDPALKLKAQIMLDWLLADFAAEYLKGMFCGGHSRVYEPQVYDLKLPAMSAYGYLFFGETEFNPKARLSHVVFGALSSYRLPAIIWHIATDRSKPYIHRERKRVRNVIRYGPERNPPVYKYDYMTKDFCLGSLQGGILQPIQQHTWDVSWVSEKKYSTIFSIHPYYSAIELAMFFPEEIKTMVREVVKSKPTYDKPNKWTGSSPYEQTFQHKNAIIVLYNIPKGTTYEHVNIFIPKNLDELVKDPSGWIFCKGGRVYVALYPLKPCQWIEEEINWRVRSPFRKNGLILEVVSQDDYPSFQAFQDRVRKGFLDTRNFDQTLTVTYQTTGGDTLRFTYGGPRQVNCRTIDWANFPLFDGPFMHAEVGSQRLTLRHGSLERILDLKALEISERVME